MVENSQINDWLKQAGGGKDKKRLGVLTEVRKDLINL